MFRNIYYHLPSQMSQTLQNQLLLAKSMNSIITLSDGAGTTITDGQITTNELTGTNLNVTNVDTTNMTLQNLTMGGSFEVPDVNDITTTYGLVSFANNGQTYLAKNLYLSAGYLLPYFPLSTTSYRLGLNSMQYLNSLSINNIGIGTNALSGKTGVVNQVTSSIAIGNNSFSSSPYGTWFECFNNVSIGDNCQKYNRYQSQDSVCIGGQVASSIDIASTFSSVLLGANIGKTSLSGYNSAVVIGSNVLTRSGANSSVIIGSNAFGNSTFSYANGICVVGYNSGLNVIANNRLTIFGNESLKNLNTNAFNMAIGPECANSLVNNTYCMCFGAFSDCNNNLKNSTSFGISCVTSESNTFKVCGDDAGLTALGYVRTQDFLISKKNRLLCGFFNTTGTVVLTFELGEYFFITGPTPTVIILPTPVSATTGSQNVTNFGARFTIVRTTASATQNITINPPSGQFIYFNGVASSSYSFSSSESYVELVCCNNGAGNSSWAVAKSQQVATGGFATGLSTNTISPYVVGTQCDLWTTSTATTINIGHQTSPQIINFSKINTNSIEPKTVGSDINMFTTTIASFLNFGNSGDYIDANFYVNPKFFGAVNFNNVAPLNLTGIPTSAITNYGTFTGGITASATQTINFGANAPTMRGDNIVADSIGQTQIDSGYLDLFTNQTIPFGIKTFTNPPVMSGASITATSIPNSALQTTVTLNDTASTFSATKTFTGGITASGTQTITFGSNAPTMSGANISANSIGQTQVNNGYLDLTTNQTITSGIKKFETAPSTGFQTLSGTGTVTFSLTGGKDILLSNSGITGVTLPTPTTDSLGQVFTLIRNGIAPTGSYAIGTQNTADRIVIDSVVIASYQTAFSQSSITVTALATSGTCWILSNYNNVNGLILSKYIYPLSWAGTFPSNSNYANINLISIGSGCLNSQTTLNYFSNAGAVYIGANVCRDMTANPTGVVIIGNSGFLATTTGVISNTTAVGGDVAKLYAQTGTGNTLLGFGSDFTAASSFSNSTAVGRGSLISASNVVVLGRTTETTIIPSASVQYGSSYRPNSVFKTISGTVDWSGASAPTNLPKYILFSAIGAAGTNYNITIPLTSNANVFEGMELIFRRTNTTASSTIFSSLTVVASGTDTIYGIGIMTTAASVVVLANGAYYGKIVCVNKVTSGSGQWAYFPS
jgi:hypothetical protein